jgi:RimJ/RimL family protein N-acetyltransferase
MATVETRRLVLRLPDASDVRPLLEIHRDPEVIRYIGTGVPGGLAVAWRTVAMMIGHWHMRGYGRADGANDFERHLRGARCGSQHTRGSGSSEAGNSWRGSPG